MRRIRTQTALIALLGTVAVSDAIAQKTNDQAPPATAARRSGPTWQYGYFTETEIGKRTFYGFLSGGKSCDGESLDEFLKKCAGKAGTGSLGQATYDDLLNALGADGWELLQIRERLGNYGGTTFYYFKRQEPRS